MDSHGARGVGGRGVNRVRIHPVDESGSVVQVEWSRGCDSFSSENGHCQLVAEPTIGAGWEEVRWRINVNHRHGESSDATARLDIYINRRRR
jgi:hypothetical protein